MYINNVQNIYKNVQYYIALVICLYSAQIYFLRYAMSESSRLGLWYIITDTAGGLTNEFKRKIHLFVPIFWMKISFKSSQFCIAITHE